MAFRIESDGEGWVRFVRRRSLFEKPSVVYTVVENLTRPPPGKKSAFAFNTRLLFFDGKGNVSGVPFLGGGKISARKKVSVPEGAEAAEFRVDCRVCGVHELSVPHFSPEEPKTVKRKKEKE